MDKMIIVLVCDHMFTFSFPNIKSGKTFFYPTHNSGHGCLVSIIGRLVNAPSTPLSIFILHIEVLDQGPNSVLTAVTYFSYSLSITEEPYAMSPDGRLSS